MSDDLSDEELAEVIDGYWPADGEEEGVLIASMAAEIRRRRAALSADAVALLREVRALVTGDAPVWRNGDDGDWMAARSAAAVSLLDRLIAAA